MSTPSSSSNPIPDELPASAPRTTSLAAAAAMNAGLQREASNEETHNRQTPSQSAQAASPNIDGRTPSERQRTSISMNLNLNDPALPAPGEMQTTSGGMAGGGIEHRSSSRTFHTPPLARSPVGSRSRSSSLANRHHGRQPSVGEVYQEMEQEQEAQVNRLLQTIRLQQQQLQTLQGKSETGTSMPDHPSPTSERSPSFSYAAAHPATHSPLSTTLRSRRESLTSPVSARGLAMGHQMSHSISSEHDHAVSPGQVTPALPTPGSSVSGAVKDEVAFYQAEVQNLSRENQMLKARIRELERQATAPQSPSVNPSAPPLASHLSQEQSIDGEVIPNDVK